MARLDGKVAIITGGARGMGAATARAFVAAGARVAIADVLEEDGSALAAELGDAARFYRLDVTDEQSWAETVARTEQELGPVDVLVNNAGVLMFKSLLQTSPEDYRRVLDVNLVGEFLGIKAVAPGMVARGAGAIVNISSVDGMKGANGLAAYASSKWGVRGLTKVAAMELGHLGVRAAVPCPAPVPGPDGVPAPCATPRALAAAELPALVEEFAQAARNAVAAGLDGVELHCASGYLINQFLNPCSNLRSDEWGGPVENRIRFPIAVLTAMAEAIGPGRVGYRIAPGNPYNGMDPSDPVATFAPFIKAADALGLAYVHVIDMRLADLDTLAMVRANWSGAVIVNNEFTAASAQAALDAGEAEAVSFGRPFIANPDLVARMQAGAALAKPDYKLLYTGEDRGYTDYPAL